MRKNPYSLINHHSRTTQVAIQLLDLAGIITFYVILNVILLKIRYLECNFIKNSWG